MTETPAPKANTGLIVGLVLAVFFVLLVMFAVPTVGILAAIAIPNFIAMQLKAKRAELPSNLQGIQVAELAYNAAFDKYAPCGSPYGGADLLSKTTHPWASDPGADCFETQLGWRPSDEVVRGTYWVTVNADGTDFEAHALADVDGDGEYSEYVTSENVSPALVSDRNAY